MFFFTNFVKKYLYIYAFIFFYLRIDNKKINKFFYS